MMHEDRERLIRDLNRWKLIAGMAFLGGLALGITAAHMVLTG